MARDPDPPRIEATRAHPLDRAGHHRHRDDQGVVGRTRRLRRWHRDWSHVRVLGARRRRLRQLPRPRAALRDAARHSHQHHGLGRVPLPVPLADRRARHPQRRRPSARPGLDVRGDGGQIVAPPSIHPNGNTYQWDAGLGDDIAEAPGGCWSSSAPNRRPRPPSARSPLPRIDPATAGRRPRRGANCSSGTGGSSTTSTATASTTGRPGKELRDGTSATTGYKGSDVLKVFTSSMRAAGLDEEQTHEARLPGVDPVRRRPLRRSCGARRTGWSSPRRSVRLAGVPRLGCAAHRAHPRGAARPADPDADNDDEGHWQFVDLDPILDGTFDPPVPTLLPAPMASASSTPGASTRSPGNPAAARRGSHCTSSPTPSPLAARPCSSTTRTPQHPP